MKSREQSYFSLSSTIDKPEFLKRFFATVALSVFIAGYFWILSVNYPSLVVFPVLFWAIAVAGHTLAAVYIVKRLRTLGDYSKHTAVVFIPFFGVMYALPTALIDNDFNYENTYMRTESELENAA